VQDAPRRDIIPRFAERDFRDRVKHDPEFVQYVDEHGGREGIVASVLRNPALKPYEGRRATEVARMRGLEDDPAEAVFDLVLEEGNFPHGVYPSAPARVLGLTDRGTLRVGHHADVVVLDPNTVADRATFEQPKQYPSGVEYVLVNGELVVGRGEHTGARPGEPIYGVGKRAARPTS
jgi:hypothetical protein